MKMTKQRRRRAGTGALVAGLLFVGCTVQQNNQYQVDLVPFGYHVHLYRTTTMMVWFAHSAVCGWDASCTLQKVKDQADVNGVLALLTGPGAFFDDDAGDFNDALMATEHPWPLSINLADQYGCLGGYKSVVVPLSDGDWYADARSAPWCHVGAPL